ncbi:MAG TPA: glycosyltransferase family 39 protein, partial [Acidimicrobiia bacterium]|nr:glycosyltransferase family 39 protein [Acidimicrobiia bacterium]
PLHYPLLYLGDLLAGGARNGPRVIPVVSGLVAGVSTWGIAERLGCSRSRALLAGLIVVTTGSMLWATGPASGDGPAAALAVAALWAAVCTNERPGMAALSGLLFGASLATKPLAFAAAVPIAWYLGVRRRRIMPAAIAAASAIAVWFVSAIPWGLHRVWDQSIAFHLHKSWDGSPLVQFAEVGRWLAERDVLLVGLLVLAAIAGLRHTVSRRESHADLVVVLIWTGLTILTLGLEKLLLRTHLAVLVPALALLVALRPPPRRWLVPALVVLVPLQLVQVSGIAIPSGYAGPDRALMHALRTVPSDAHLISDVQGFVWQSGHITPRLLNDNSYARIQGGLLTTPMLAQGAAQPQTCGVIIWSFRFDRKLPGLREALTAAHYTPRVFAPGHELWLKDPSVDPICRAGGAGASGRSRG